jgi:hypothetical protein
MAKVVCERQSWQEGDGYTTGVRFMRAGYTRERRPRLTTPERYDFHA